MQALTSHARLQHAQQYNRTVFALWRAYVQHRVAKKARDAAMLAKVVLARTYTRATQHHLCVSAGCLVLGCSHSTPIVVSLAHDLSCLRAHSCEGVQSQHTFPPICIASAHDSVAGIHGTTTSRTASYSEVCRCDCVMYPAELTPTNTSGRFSATNTTH